MGPGAPFGFVQGMTLDELERAAGPLQPGKRADTWHATRAPAPHEAFRSYTFVVSPSAGLVRVVAMGRELGTDRAGTEVRREFARLRATLSRAYGAGRTIERALAERWKDPAEFMLGLLMKGRVLATLWERGAPLPPGVVLALVKVPPDVSSLLLAARALGPELGCVTLGCEFSTFREFEAGRPPPPDPRSP